MPAVCNSKYLDAFFFHLKIRHGQKGISSMELLKHIKVQTRSPKPRSAFFGDEGRDIVPPSRRRTLRSDAGLEWP